jgi:hypothetical protein
MTQAYLEVVQGDLAGLDSARSALIEALLTSDLERRSELARRAMGLGFEVERQLVAVVAVVVLEDEEEPSPPTPRWATQAIARCSGRSERSAFVVSRERDIVAVLDRDGNHPARLVLERAAAALRHTHPADLRRASAPLSLASRSSRPAIARRAEPCATPQGRDRSRSVRKTSPCSTS